MNEETAALIAATRSYLRSKSLPRPLPAGVRSEVSAGIRRRREAARRLPALDGGHRDPLDALAAVPVTGTPVAYDTYDVIDLGTGCCHEGLCPARATIERSAW